MITRKIIFYSLLAVFGIMFLSSMFMVDQRQSAIVFQFGEAVRVIEKPGLYFKLPVIHKAHFFDNRILNVNVEAKELTAIDSKRVIVDSFAKFKIKNPVKFYKTVFNYYNANIRLSKILESSMRKVIGQVHLMELLSDKRSSIMQRIYNLLNEEAQNFGIEAVDVRILKADLPKANSFAIYTRMQTERQKEAKQIRSEGKEESAKITSTADKESKVILANAYKEAEFIKAKGDAEATRIYNNIYSKDPEFYKFYRSMDIYKKTLKNAQIILSTDSEFLKYLKFEKR